ncbi:hypothetical protein D918_08872 [Trichuris suis]|nr:hypothetical protein D918_08872 [Trichuris suis]
MGKVANAMLLADIVHARAPWPPSLSFRITSLDDVMVGEAKRGTLKRTELDIVDGSASRLDLCFWSSL